MSLATEVAADAPSALYWFDEADTNPIGPTVSAYTASSSYPGEGPTLVADNNHSNGWTINSGTAGWLQFQLSAAYAVTKYYIWPRTSWETRNPGAWTFEGSNDGSTWTVLDTRSGIAGWVASTPKAFSFANSTAYLYYRINMTATAGGTQLGIGEMYLQVPFLPSYGAPLIDSSGNGRHGFKSSGCSIGGANVIPERARSTSFDGSVNAVATVPFEDWQAPATFTAEAVIVVEAYKNNGNVVFSRMDWGSGFGPNYVFNMQTQDVNGSYSAYRNNAGPTYGGALTGGLMGLNLVLHLALKYDGTNIKAFVNGNLVATTAMATPLSTGVQHLRFGRTGYTGYNQGFQGRMQMQAFYSGVALSDARIAAHAAEVFNATGQSITNPSVINYTNGALVSWTNRYTQADYRIDGGAITTTSASQLSLTGLTNGVTYNLEVRPRSGSTVGNWTAMSVQPAAGTYFDNFDRANVAPALNALGNATSGQAWAGQSGAIGILSNQAYATASADNIATFDPGSLDYTIEYVVAHYDAYAAVHYRDVNNLMQINGRYIYRRVAGNWITLYNYGTNPAATDKVKIACKGKQVKLWVNGTLRFVCYDDYVQATDTKFGLRMATASARADNFQLYPTKAADFATMLGAILDPFRTFVKAVRPGWLYKGRDTKVADTGAVS